MLICGLWVNAAMNVAANATMDATTNITAGGTDRRVIAAEKAGAHDDI